MTENPPLWKANVHLAKELAADVAAVLELSPPVPQAVLIVDELFKETATVEALYSEPPDAELLSRLTGHSVSVAALPDQDWIKLSQEGLPPVRAGRFFVYGAHDAGRVPPAVIPMRIDAGLAFGTGHHETTALCLEALSDLAKRRTFAHTLDLGCGTGLLAIGAVKLWRKKVIASDIDPVAVDITRQNARANGEAPYIRAVAADGLTHAQIRAGAPYDLIVANILAGPLTQLAPAIAGALAKGGVLLLSGLLINQENLVVSFYTPHGLILRGRRRAGPWSALVLAKPPA
ncbi:MAG TPA: 50S ribosomal protein L11 methyltransferase [Rhizomicrobium sp.]|nr:50S ribosomal protein L11 methyltransferase [Rhizomicrobium sp.]